MMNPYTQYKMISKSIYPLVVAAFLIHLFFACNPIPNNGFDRNPQQIHYSKHARCRMSCRNISEKEVEDIIHHGEINLRKSELNADAAHKRYTLEGVEQNVRLRIVVAESGKVATVITCIDLDHEWKCDCPGDEKHH